MTGKWITGKEIMENYGKAAVEIGQACYDGILKAFTADVLTPVLEESKLGHIPKYPPVGVNPCDHIQYTATPNWDWSGHVRFDRQKLREEYAYLRAEYDDISRNSSPDECPEFDDFILMAVLRSESITTKKLRSAGIIPLDLDLDKLNPNAVYSAHLRRFETNGDKSIIVPMVALLFMQTQFDYYADVSGEIKTFCFLFPTFKEWRYSQPGNNSSSLPESEIISIYKETLGKLWFERDQVLKWLGHDHSAPAAPPATGSNKDIARIRATRQACEKVRAEIEQRQHGFLVRGKYRTNRKRFLLAVQAELGTIPYHRDAAKSEWEKVRSEIKHPGRDPDQ